MEFEREEIHHGNVVEKLDQSQHPPVTLDAVREHPQQQVGERETEVKLSDLPRGQVVLPWEP